MPLTSSPLAPLSPRDDLTIYLVRHGETEWNRLGRMQGQLDSPLTTRGRAQAARIGGRLAEERAAGFIEDFEMQVSPLGRAWASADIICGVLELDPAVRRPEPRLREFSFGDWDGLTRAQIIAQAPEAFAAREKNKWHTLPPNGESYAMVAERVAHWYASLAAGTVIAVCHGGLGRVMRGLYAGHSIEAILAMGEPQEAYFRLHRGAVEQVDV